MRWPIPSLAPRDTVLTLAAGGFGALLFWWLHAPVYMLLGPVIAVSVLGLMGVRTAVDPRLRDACFVVLGIAVGAGFNQDAVNAMLRWPLAFVFMTGVI
ncbi:AbrB family transcriptional regulator [Sulfitobacter sp. 1A12157]|uniref:AbrB family transcriptional regulator n=1 Tax=Sulfitobacter sp. 1A12157 TaxID=3368594 RepID=UPI0037450222